VSRESERPSRPCGDCRGDRNLEGVDLREWTRDDGLVTDHAQVPGEFDSSYSAEFGPRTIQAAMAPGGIVLQMYGRDSGSLVSETGLTRDICASAAQTAHAVGQAHAPGTLIMVVYDGDTGLRWSWEDYMAVGFPRGQAFLLREREEQQLGGEEGPTQ